MKPHLKIVFALIALAPMVLLVWLGVRLSADERRSLYSHLRAMELDQLGKLGDSINILLESKKSELLARMESLASEKSTKEIVRRAREFSRKDPLVRQVFVLGPGCGRVYPPMSGPMSSAEVDFVARASAVWSDWLALCKKPVFSQEQGASEATGSAPPSNGKTSDWYSWRWAGAGADLVLWSKPKGAGMIGVELNSIALLSDIVGALPATEAGQSRVKNLTALLDASAKVLYQWGAYSPSESDKPMAELKLAPPLGHWRLVRYQSKKDLEAIVGASIRFGMIAVLVVAGLLILLLAGYFLRQHINLMKEAANRISFVNRVSHELRTPLTNIMLYAELLHDQLGKDDLRDRKYTEIISSESGRLGRLIDNVLTFSREQSKGLNIHRGAGVVDETIEAVLANFAPSLEQAGVQVEFYPGASQVVLIDRDALSQILGNLLSNVEKYVPRNSRVSIHSHMQGRYSIVRVCDDGPGIAKKMHKKVFEPFFRISNRLTDGVSGTGLGLGIARDLARLHGGDLKLVPQEKGVCFEITLDTGDPKAVDAQDENPEV